MNLWRWDQGRLEYFLFDNLQAIASCLSGLDGIELNPKDIDPLRPVLESDTGLQFSPSHYRVWRNYARVFGCSLLATRAGKHLLVSDICRKIADGTIRDVDEYLTLLVQRFRFPSPVFESYSASEQVVFPFITLLKYLYSKSKDNAYPNVTVDEVFSVVIGNGCTGLESREFYSKLKSTGLKPGGDQERQVREMMSVLSQFSFLKWANKKLYLDTSFDLQGFLSALQPYSLTPVLDRVEEFVKLTSWESAPKLTMPGREFETPVDLVFTEGKRSRITHLKIERSPLLRKIFFEQRPRIQCDMCELEPRKRYPWTDNLLEIHHLLPLSSGIAVTLTGTSFNDIVPLCPNCHRSVHIYYKIWLNGQQKLDFTGKSEARIVYKEAKQNISL